MTVAKAAPKAETVTEFVDSVSMTWIIVALVAGVAIGIAIAAAIGERQAQLAAAQDNDDAS